jgi:selenocysteine-specific elongation factor
MIVATAGHVDHGKTLLIKALTGVDTDRLPEEKRRGMTIDLGFAYRRVGSDDTIGFIDVPGHERFIRNMLCGVAAIDFVLFVVAVDDGPMPQTREHLAILNLLGVSRGAIVLTKTDRATSERIESVAAQVRTLVADTTLANAPVWLVSAVAGTGVGELQDHLEQAARDCPTRSGAGNFRMPVDRCFTIPGAGLVVTGTAVAGAVAAGDHARAVLAELPVRVRTIHAQNTPTAIGRAGQRCALNLTSAGLKGAVIVRGDWIVTGDVPAPGRKFDARLKILPSEQRPLAHWTPVHLYLGAAEALGRIAVLDGREISPGSSALVQLVLERPISALRGDRFIVRDQSAQRTIGGGSIIDVFPPTRGRARPERLAYLAAVANDDDVISLGSLLDAAAQGVNLSKFSANRNLTAEEAAAMFARSPMRAVPTKDGLLGYSSQRWANLKSSALEQLAAWHQRAPDMLGPSGDQIFSGVDMRLPREVCAAMVAELVAEGRAAKDGVTVRLSTHQPRLNPADAAICEKNCAAARRRWLAAPDIAANG